MSIFSITLAIFKFNFVELDDDGETVVDEDVDESLKVSDEGKLSKRFKLSLEFCNYNHV